MIRRLLLAGVVATTACSDSPSRAPGTFIANALLFDGSGTVPFVGSVRFEGDRIVGVGAIAPGPEDWFFDGQGMALAPGFIDTHSHADRRIFDLPDALAAVSQGVTTVVVGQDGGAPFPLSEFFARLDSTPAAVNVAAFAGHGTLRRAVLGSDFRRAATRAEVDSMRTLLYRELDAGALGLSTGLEYDPGIYADYAELVSLAQTLSAEGGRYISHIRSEDRAFWPAVEEIIALGRDADLPVQITHLKLAMRGLWGGADSLIGVLDAARASGVDITADLYPYTYWQSSLTVLFPARNFEDRREAELVLGEIAAPEGLRLGRYEANPEYAGRTVAEIARLRGTAPAVALMDLIRDARAADAEESVIGTSMDEGDVERLLAWPFVAISTDGELDGAHPRGFGAFARVLGHYVRDREVLNLEEAIRRMTSLAARNAGIENRGVLREGAYADLVLFRPELVADRATLDQPHVNATGIGVVWVNGEMVYDAERATGKHPGRPLRRFTRSTRSAPR